MNPYFFDAAILAALAFVIYQQTQHERFLMMTTQEAVDKVVSVLEKARTEILAARDALNAKIVDLQGQVDAAGVAEQVDLSDLTAVAQSLDDIVPDVPVETPDDVAADTTVDVPADPPVE